jgi:hypothetical protein
MPEKNGIRRLDEDVREGVNEIDSASSSVEDRIVTNPDPEESQPKLVKQKKPIVSVDGEDVAA